MQLHVFFKYYLFYLCYVSNMIFNENLCFQHIEKSVSGSSNSYKFYHSHL